jgi:hypothetical protein
MSYSYSNAIFDIILYWKNIESHDYAILVHKVAFLTKISHWGGIKPANGFSHQNNILPKEWREQERLEE